MQSVPGIREYPDARMIISRSAERVVVTGMPILTYDVLVFTGRSHDYRDGLITRDVLLIALTAVSAQLFSPKKYK